MRTRGHTLPELVLVLTLLGVLGSIAFPPVARWRDRAAVRAARDELAGALALTRMSAASHAGARLVLDAPAARFWILPAGRSTTTVDLGDRYGVTLDAGSAEPVVFRYDALGIARLSNRTVRIRRAGAEAGVTVNLYGRVRRW